MLPMALAAPIHRIGEFIGGFAAAMRFSFVYFDRAGERAGAWDGFSGAFAAPHVTVRRGQSRWPVRRNLRPRFTTGELAVLRILAGAARDPDSQSGRIKCLRCLPAWQK
jgi:hypothetical protein